MKCIIGLGNPGKTYEKTRHNVGFMVLDALAKEFKIEFKSKFKAEIAQINVLGETLLLVKPQTYMNLSGESVRLIKDFYKLNDDDFLVVYDDLDLPVGKLRLREKGSSGGHNGIKSIHQHLGHTEFKRLRIGIDNNKLIPTADYVLGKFSKEESEALEKSIEVSVKACLDFSTLSFVDLMSRYNTKA